LGRSNLHLCQSWGLLRRPKAGLLAMTRFAAATLSHALRTGHAQGAACAGPSRFCGQPPPEAPRVKSSPAPGPLPRGQVITATPHPDQGLLAAEFVLWGAKVAIRQSQVAALARVLAPRRGTPGPLNPGDPPIRWCAPPPTCPRRPRPGGRCAARQWPVFPAPRLPSAESRREPVIPRARRPPRSQPCSGRAERPYRAPSARPASHHRRVRGARRSRRRRCRRSGW
jgi:hypothetical protein